MQPRPENKKNEIKKNFFSICDVEQVAEEFMDRWDSDKSKRK